ncbi:MAG: hypothetical protein KGN36_13190 [Acidobacteriota bacterium]|nr:hypothetical protein [Acidobacteriota bacterium]
MEARAESPFLNPAQRASDFAKQLRFTVEILNGYLALDGTLGIFQSSALLSTATASRLRSVFSASALLRLKPTAARRAN